MMRLLYHKLSVLTDMICAILIPSKVIKAVKEGNTMIAMNSYRYNYEMELWLLRDYTAKDLLDNWNDIYRYASTEESEDDVYFLADCLDVLSEKVLQLSERDRTKVLEKAKKDITGMSIGENVLRMAG